VRKGTRKRVEKKRRRLSRGERKPRVSKGKKKRRLGILHDQSREELRGRMGGSMQGMGLIPWSLATRRGENDKVVTPGERATGNLFGRRGGFETGRK